MSSAKPLNSRTRDAAQVLQRSQAQATEGLDGEGHHLPWCAAVEIAQPLLELRAVHGAGSASSSRELRVAARHAVADGHVQ